MGCKKKKNINRRIIILIIGMLFTHRYQNLRWQSSPTPYHIGVHHRKSEKSQVQGYVWHYYTVFVLEPACFQTIKHKQLRSTYTHINRNERTAVASAGTRAVQREFGADVGPNCRHDLKFSEFSNARNRLDRRRFTETRDEEISVGQPSVADRASVHDETGRQSVADKKIFENSMRYLPFQLTVVHTAKVRRARTRLSINADEQEPWLSLRPSLSPSRQQPSCRSAGFHWNERDNNKM